LSFAGGKVYIDTPFFKREFAMKLFSCQYRLKWCGWTLFFFGKFKEKIWYKKLNSQSEI
jgi:hypothetical protein